VAVWGGDVDRSGSAAAQQAVQAAGVSVTEQRALTAGENRRHPVPFLGEARVADGVHARKAPVKDPVAPVCLQPMPREAEPEELLPRDDSVLPKREIGEACVT
jgi:hypothetical protein